ncbi:peptidase A4 family-domain-containing protein [Boletus edulis BED1]|uniref:Peptidase A4 family-domain-containing protein n=1 Tax=Boletus edulis BED1 TaxID=1328754 RepID=A0AAD4BI09_BOLED|nr:peptidase A4 family-domain-containing protein [Boletus edulis BED1]
MRFNSVLIPCFLFASAVLANARRPQQFDLSETPTVVIDDDHRAGATWNLSPGTFNHVHAIFAVPAMTSVNGAQSFADVMVFIDGAGATNCPNAILGVGVNFHVEPDGNSHITAILVTNPNDLYNTETLDIPISVGDLVQLTIVSSNATTGHVFIDNLTTLRSVDKEAQLTEPLCGQSAGWVVSQANAKFPRTFYTLANFGTVMFTGVSAGIQGGIAHYPYGATLLRMRGHTIPSPWGDSTSTTSSTIAFGDSSLWITYI